MATGTNGEQLATPRESTGTKKPKEGGKSREAAAEASAQAAAALPGLPAELGNGLTLLRCVHAMGRCSRHGARWGLVGWGLPDHAGTAWIADGMCAWVCTLQQGRISRHAMQGLSGIVARALWQRVCADRETMIGWAGFMPARARQLAIAHHSSMHSYFQASAAPTKA